jgi:hypothetical protein
MQPCSRTTHPGSHKISLAYCSATQQMIHRIVVSPISYDTVNPPRDSPSKEAKKVSHCSRKTLKPALWITDEVINCYLLRVLHSQQQQHLILQLFLLLQVALHRPRWYHAPCNNFRETNWWGSRLRRRQEILGLKELFVPINHLQEHWLFL